MVKLLKSIYPGVKYCVKYKSVLTHYFDCMNGVRQGYIISPILFCFFLNDFKDYVSVDSHGIDLEICKLFLLLFADGLVIFADSTVYNALLIIKQNGYCVSLRKKVLPAYFYDYPVEMEVQYLMNLTDVQLKTNICKYLIEALKLRAELLLSMRILTCTIG